MATCDQTKHSGQMPWDVRLSWSGRVGEYDHTFETSRPIIPFRIIDGQNPYKQNISNCDSENEICLRYSLVPYVWLNAFQENENLEGLSLWIAGECAQHEVDEELRLSIEIKVSIGKVSEAFRYTSIPNIILKLKDAMGEKGVCVMQDFAMLSLNMRGRKPAVISKYSSEPVFISTFLTAKMTKLSSSSVEGTVHNTSTEGHALSDFRAMYEAADNHSDIKLQSKDNMIVSSHKFVLAARRKYFARVLQDSKAMIDTEILPVGNIDAKPLNVILHWMYTDQFPENVAVMIVAVVDAAVKLELQNLIKSLDLQLVNFCNVDNMFQLAAIFKQHSLSNALKDISQFIRKNIDTFAD